MDQPDEVPLCDVLICETAEYPRYDSSLDINFCVHDLPEVNILSHSVARRTLHPPHGSHWQATNLTYIRFTKRTWHNQNNNNARGPVKTINKGTCRRRRPYAYDGARCARSQRIFTIHTVETPLTIFKHIKVIARNYLSPQTQHNPVPSHSTASC